MLDTRNNQVDAHTGPIKNPAQLLVAVFFSFVVPIFAIIGLVYYVVSDIKPAGSANEEAMTLGGVTQQSRERGVLERIQKIGMVEIRDANRPLATGEAVFKAQCVACHGTPGIPGSPHLGDAAAWAPRIPTGYEALLNSALHGKGAMGPQGGGDFEDVEIGRAVVYMTNAAGGNFPVPDRPAAPEAASSADGQTAAAAGGASAPATAGSGTAPTAGGIPGPGAAPAADAPAPAR